MKPGVIAFGSLVWAVPLYAQAAPDPLAPLQTPSPVQPQQTNAPNPGTNVPPAATSAPAQQPAAATSPAPAPRGVVVPRDWRSVFDAIDAGEWASAQAGIAALPKSVLTPVATAELYIAKGSPIVDLQSLQTLIIEAPELPEADQLGLLAEKRGATSAPLTIPEKPTYSIGSAPIRYKAKPVQGEPYADQLRAALDPLVKADDASRA